MKIKVCRAALAGVAERERWRRRRGDKERGPTLGRLIYSGAWVI